MTILGAVLAGGASRRFGADKSAASWQGRVLLDHAVGALRPQADALVVVGGDCTGLERIDDRPPGVGPIGGLAAAIHHAADGGFAGALCAPLDVHPMPHNLREWLGCGNEPAVFAEQHLVGWWPATLAAALDGYIAGGGRSLHGWIAACGARRVPDPPGLINVNRPSDLARLPR